MKKNPSKKPNRLIDEKSPYLLQHAYNPVDWYPWSDEAFKKAQAEHKPIFLSIGYSTCHWCHVMERESFEDPGVAKLLNENFIAIKVDREERPDIDHIYMTVCQAMTGGGGWPLTIIMTPDKKPFFAGTYFPKEPRINQVGMLQLLPMIQDLWKDRNNELITSADTITTTILQAMNATESQDLDDKVLTQAYEQLESRFDSVNGGFSSAPKFPTPHNLLFLLRYWNRNGEPKALEMVEKTLQVMRLGGIFDQLGFGFHRYSTDEFWLVPHFEKMLYDQALLVIAYLETYQATHKEEYRETAQQILEYVLRELRAPEGAFHSAEDADSEGKEGRFYIWSEAEVRHHLKKQDADFIIDIFNFERHGNYIDQIAGKELGMNILYLRKPINELAAELGRPEQELREQISIVSAKLFKLRDRRAHPYKDDKILTDWNGLMVAALAQAAQICEDSEYLMAAEKAAEFILSTMRDSKGRLLHRFRDGEASISAHLDDYVFLTWALIELYEATFDCKYLKSALELNHELLTHFWDDKNGGFFFSADDGEELLFRKKEIYDGALPSGNSVALLNLLKLARLTDDPELEAKATELSRAFANEINKLPSGHTQFMAGLEFVTGPSYEVVIQGDETSKDTKEMIKALRAHFIPNKIVHLNPAAKQLDALDKLPEFTAKRPEGDEVETRAFVCMNYACQAPTSDVAKMLEAMKVKNVISSKD